MTKHQIDYSKSIIYKIYSNVNNVNKIYVGSTTNFRNRKHKHKCLSLNNNNKDTYEYNYEIYQYINNNGGWGNFNIDILERYRCTNKQELHAREAYYINKLKPSLNKSIPLRTIKQYRIANRTKLLNLTKKWKLETNYNNKKIFCDCGSVHSLTNKSHHLKTKNHNNYLDNPFIKLTL